MTTIELDSILKKNNVPHRYYSFDGAGGGDCYSLEKSDAHWVLSYYDDRGGRHQRAAFDTENEACYALFNQMKKTVQNEKSRTISLDI